MKKKDILTLLVEDIEYPGVGVSHIDSKKVYIKNALPGEKVQAAVYKIKGAYIDTRLTEVIENSPFEIESECPHFANCGGCSLQHIPYEYELKLKEKIVFDLLKQTIIDSENSNNIKEKSVLFEKIVPSPKAEYYRNKMEYSFGDTGIIGELSLGLRKQGSYYEVLHTNNCKIADNDFNIILDASEKYFKQSDMEVYHKMKHKGTLRTLVLRKGTNSGEILVNINTTSIGLTDLNSYARCLNGLKLSGTIVSIIHTISDDYADTVKCESMKILYDNRNCAGEASYFYDKIEEVTFKITPFSFFQTNTSGAEKLYNIILDFSKSAMGKTVFDLYSGTGTIAQIISKLAKEIYAIEIVPEAVEAAKENAAVNGITNCTFLCGDVLEEVSKLSAKPDLIIVDPPRNGLHPKALKNIVSFNAPEIVYVSCKTSSLTRDIELFAASGYFVKRARVVDMFPRTWHVETVVLLQKYTEIPDKI